MSRPAVRQRISELTKAALADPDTRARQVDGLKRAWADPAKRERQRELTIERMAAWRARVLRAAAIVAQQMPKSCSSEEHVSEPTSGEP